VSLLSVTGLEVAFGSVQVLHGIDIEVGAGSLQVAFNECRAFDIRHGQRQLWVLQQLQHLK
jgi:hypothetical protein